jgi:hypothetical protein
MSFRSLTLLATLLLLTFLSGCGTDTKTTNELGGNGFSATHLDSSATSNIIEGYVIKKDSSGNFICGDCHKTDLAEITNNRQWADSAHAGHILTAGPVQDSATKYSAWTHYNWDKTNDTIAGDFTGRAVCQRCHTATGVANFLNAPATYNPANNDFSHLSAWTATTGSPQQELLYCWGCHSNVSTGTLRNPGSLTINYSNGATATYPNIGASNVCIACHTGAEVGDSIKGSTGDFTNLSFINSHYLTAGGQVFAVNGYEYAGQNYSMGYHQNIGVANVWNTGNAGPCVACHMSGTQPHTWDFLAEDSSGTITANQSTLCIKCHAAISPATLESKKESLAKALEALRLALQAKGIFFSNSYPYFFQSATDHSSANAFKNWDGVNVGTVAVPVTGKGKDVMGAAFNYNLLVHDPGSYAHNNGYALKLIQDSIDFLGDGLVDGDGSIVRTMVRTGFDVGSVNVSASPMHTVSIATVGANPLTGLTTCALCHKAAAHFGGNATAPGSAPAQWVAPFAGTFKPCTTCHAGGDISANAALLDQYATSNHGDVAGPWNHVNSTAPTVTTIAAVSYQTWCGRCHTTKGFVDQAGVNISNSPVTLWPTVAGQTMLDGVACDACHTEVITGATRVLGSFTTSYYSGVPTPDTTPPAEHFNIAVEKTYPDVGPSSICVRCHSGRDSSGIGQLIKDGTPTAGAAVLRTHYLGSGLTLFNTGGYHFGATDYTNLGSHKGIATPGAGPCVTCHMSGTAGHTFWPITEDEATGTITAVLSNACSATACHDASMTAAYLTDVRNDFKTVKQALETALQAKGIYYRNEQETGGSTGRVYSSAAHPPASMRPRR